MKKFFINFVILFSSLLLLDCSTSKTNDSLNADYMPLAIGNKWYYSIYPPDKNDESKFIKEVVATDTINGKKYFLLKNSNIWTDTTINYYNYLRLSNDTLFSLNYDNQNLGYIERIDAIFSLDSNETATVHLDLDVSESLSRKAIERLPVFNHYTIKVTSKNENKIEYLIDYGHFDMKGTTTYEKGVGMVKSVNSWGAGTELKKYDLK
ncbi:MAG: hypothetical protein A2057_09210 [Ignavibacteria bacterium GWA2_35_9]|nr:MAG: hypothetical protein A2057_09210 [Ignavibacteria bacterium GWA2_35_9]OGU48700.1 MAG: hypothetical protein A2000_05145 [Ignavibacteria bacterium GWB2_36_8]OGU49667.1 MAG: hypothetical protein A2080_06235 [Ignavibacteria bacterium GWC2_36_12]